MANSFVRYTGNGSTTAYAVPFSYRLTTDVTVTINGVTKTVTSDYTYNSAGTQITFTSAPASNAAIEIRRTTSQTSRLTDYASGSVLTEDDLDTDSTQGFFMSQEAIDDAGDKISLDNADFQWSAGSKRIKNITDPTGAQDAATKNYLENTWLTPANKTALTTVNANIANINAVNSNASNVNAVSANNANVTTVANNIGSVNTVASDITKVVAVANDLAEAVSEIETVADDLNETTSEIDTVSNNIANVNTVGGISSDVSTVAGISGNVTTVAGISSDVTAVSGNSANVTAVAGNATNINAVNANSSNINAVNSNASNINSTASNETNINTVATNIGSVNTVATDITKVISVANDLAEAISEVETVADDLNETSSEIDTVSNNIANVNNVGNNIANVNTVAGVSADVTTVADNDANVTTVADNDANITTVATGISNVNTVATNVANVNAVAANSTNINAVNSNSSNINAVNTNSANINTVAGIDSDVTTVANDGTDIGTVATNIASVNTVAGNNANVTAVAGNNSNISAVATNATNINAVNANSANINTVAGNNTNINTVAGIDSDVTGVADIASAVTAVNSNSSNINTVSGNNSNVSTVAGISGNVTTVAGIASDVTAVAGDATDIGTVAGIASAVSAVNSNSSNINAVNSNSSNINTVAANNSNITTVANADSNITAVAGNASNINTVGAAIANVNSVGGNIANVNTVAGNLASVNTFGEQYRIGTSDPTTSLNEGDLFYNSTNNTLKVYDGTGWTAGVTAGSGFLPLTGGGLTGALTTNSTIDGRDVATDGTKLDGIEASATADQTNDEIKAAVEAASDSNTFTDADHTKLNGIEASATADQTGAEIKSAYEGESNTNAFTDALQTKLNGIETSATADQTKSDIDALNIDADTLDGQHGSYYTGYTDTAVSNLVDSSPAALNTLNELASALGDDANFSTTVNNNIATKLATAGGTMTGDLKLNDNVKAKFGTGNDLEIYHNGSDSYIDDNGTGDFGIRSNGTKITLNRISDGHEGLKYTLGGSLLIKHDNNNRLETTAAGVDVTGNIALTGTVDGVDIASRDAVLTSTTTTANNALPKAGGTITGDLTLTGASNNAVWDSSNNSLDFADSAQLRFGAGADLKIFHDGSDSHIVDSGTGNLKISTSALQIMNAAGNENLVLGTQDGAVNLYHDNSKKLETTSGGITVTGGIAYTSGNISKNSGEMTIRNTANNQNISLQTNSSGSNIEALKINSGGNVDVLNGSITASGNVTAYSDERLKSDIKTIDNALDKVSQMRGVTFTKDDKLSSGVIAQEMEQVAPELVQDGEYKSVAYGNTVGYLIEAIKELKAEVADLKCKKECECE